MRRDRHAPQADGAFYSSRHGEAAAQFFERHLRFGSGATAGQPFVLRPWQRAWVEDLWGWRRESDGRRLYRRTFGALPRGNGKTTTASGLALALLIGDGVQAAEVYSIAGNKDQAAIVFNDAQTMCATSPGLRGRVELLKESIYVPQTRGVFRPLAGRGRVQHGKKPYAVIGDELHAWKGREQYEAMATAMGKMPNTMEVYITTAGEERESLCGAMWDHADQVLRGVVDDPSLYALIYAADPESDWMSPETWARANPNLGVSVQEDYLADYVRRARTDSSEEATFKRLHLNLWTTSGAKWLPAQAWASAANSGPIDEQSLIGRPCYLGLDAAASKDMCAAAAVFPPCGPDPKWVTLVRFFLPRGFEGDVDGIERRSRAHSTPYAEWARAGALTLTDAELIGTHEEGAVAAALVDFADRFQARGLGYDRAHAVGIMNRVLEQRSGMAVYPLGQGGLTLAAACDTFEAAVLSGGLRHGGHPVLRWNADNVGVRRDAEGRAWQPVRGGAHRPHDGISAILNAMTLALAGRDENIVTSDKIIARGGLL